MDGLNHHTVPLSQQALLSVASFEQVILTREVVVLFQEVDVNRVLPLSLIDCRVGFRVDEEIVFFQFP